MLDIVASYHRNQFQGKLMMQTQENGKMSVMPVGPKFGPPIIFIFFLKNLAPSDTSYHHEQYQKKLMIQS